MIALSDDPYNLQRFIDAQDPVYEQVCSELQQGSKRSHWMWFVFPQIAGLGRSEMARKFAISSLDEAVSYLEDPVLGPRLRECTNLVLDVPERTVHEIFGSPDDLKFWSSMTLFAHAAADNQVFQAVLGKYFRTAYDPLTLAQLHS